MIRWFVPACFALLVLGWLPGQHAEAANCRYQEMELLRLQGGSGSPAAIKAARSRLAACQGNASAAPGWGSDRQRERSQPAAPAPPRTANTPRQRQRGEAPGTQSVTVPRRSGTYRTLCVRPCDGYYFPISFSTTRKHLETDRELCRKLCPAADAELYYHSVRYEGPMQMRSLEGQPYAELENAFSYRTALDKSCTCGAPTFAADRSAAILAAIKAEPTRLPTPRPPRGLDPETALNRIGGFAPLQPEPVVPIISVSSQIPATVRIILPPWDPTDSEVLLSPVPKRPGES